MTAGVPGTGVTSVFYLMLVLLMPVREAYLTVRGRSSLARWRAVAGQWALTMGIIVLLWAEGCALAWLIGPAEASSRVGGNSGLVQLAAHNVLTVSTLLVAALTLAGIWVAVHCLRLVIWPSSADVSADEGPARASVRPSNDGAARTLRGLGAG